MRSLRRAVLARVPLRKELAKIEPECSRQGALMPPGSLSAREDVRESRPMKSLLLGHAGQINPKAPGQEAPALGGREAIEADGALCHSGNVVPDDKESDFPLSRKKKATLLGARLREVRRALGLTLQQFAAPLGVTSVHVGQVERGDSGASALFLKAVEQQWRIARAWLETGEGPRRVEDAPLTGEAHVWREDMAPYVVRAETPEEQRILQDVKSIIESNNDMVIHALKTNLAVFLKALGQNRRRRHRQ